MKYILDPGRGKKVVVLLEEALVDALRVAPINSAWFPILYLFQGHMWEKLVTQGSQSVIDGRWEPAERRIIPAKVLIEGEGPD